jgi:paraquat-inducible protein B
MPAQVPEVPASPARAHRRRGLGWLVAAGVAVTAGVLAASGYKYFRNGGNPVTIHFQDARGLRAGADLRYRGVPIGRVTEVRVRPDLGGVDVRVAITDHADRVARKGSRFWIVRPNVSMATGVSGLDTAIGDKYVAVLPAAAGEPAAEFEGAEEPPLAEPAPGSGTFQLKVKKPDLASTVRVGAPVTCCGVRIGQVQTVELANGGRELRATVCIEPGHAKLVRQKSSFVALKIFRSGSGWGLPSLDLQALGGGVELQVPEKPGEPPAKGQVFELS